MQLFTGEQTNVVQLGAVKMPRFIMRVNYAPSQGLEFDPPISEVEEVVLDGLNFVVRTMDTLPRIESIIYSGLADALLTMESESEDQAPRSRANSGKRDGPIKESPIRFTNNGVPEIKVLFDSKEYIQASSQLKRIVAGCFENVKRQLALYDRFLHLYSLEVNEKTEKFFAEEHSFEDYTAVTDRILKTNSKRKLKDIERLHLKSTRCHADLISL